MNNKIDIYKHMNHIMSQLKTGILITCRLNDRVNSLTVAWGQVGFEWNKLIFTAFIRTGRYTHDMIVNKKEFTVNIPMEDKAGKILGFCGTKSGRDYDKAKELGLTFIESENVDVPGIKELPLTLECKVLYSQLQDKNNIPDDLKTEFYPQDAGSDYHSANRDFHTMFIAEIVGAYIAE
ncbi:MAG: flavin reductase [Spirochaetales bacterium]|uniref:Flavin reductase n=1 Tax=Candidatus Thalassospirochaeta sargassi TaxID=3119039 RepID=A0AAJ1MJM9_9SPIO|nr:flavin reductase [Spirochaetales bacterium]